MCILDVLLHLLAALCRGLQVEQVVLAGKLQRLLPPNLPIPVVEIFEQPLCQSVLISTVD